MNYLQFDFKISNEISSDTLVAVLSTKNFEGFEETDLLLKAFLPEENLDKAVISELKELFPTLEFTRMVVEHINWNAEWEANFQPVTIDNFVGIRAHFHQPMKDVIHEIVITPKMSFGTGHHSTTHMMVQLMRNLAFTNKAIVDFGTGTGVLAILAKKAGAAKVVAVDNDEWSIDNARENFERNETADIELIQMDTLPADGIFDIILANINLNILQNNMKAIATAASNDGKILLSGFLPDDLPAIKEALLINKLTFIKTIKHNNWSAVMAAKQV